MLLEKTSVGGTMCCFGCPTPHSHSILSPFPREDWGQGVQEALGPARSSALFSIHPMAQTAASLIGQGSGWEGAGPLHRQGGRLSPETVFSTTDLGGLLHSLQLRRPRTA